MAFSIRVGDEVQVMSGARNRNRERPATRGRVVSIDREAGFVTVEKYNLRTKHLKRSQRHPGGGRVEREAAIRLSRVMVVASDGKPVRLARAERVDGKIVRRPSGGRGDAAGGKTKAAPASGARGN